MSSGAADSHEPAMKFAREAQTRVIFAKTVAGLSTRRCLGVLEKFPGSKNNSGALVFCSCIVT